ncbi:MAG: beta-lactamase family protein [Kangiellaceae bacterium]|nr:beta-lactamase family protein [Kangiellaceae bacterium]
MTLNLTGLPKGLFGTTTILLLLLATKATANSAVEKAERLFSQAVSSPSVPGISVATANEDGIVWAKGFGFANLENNIPMTSQTKLRIGSIAKVITASALMRLHQQGKIDFDSPIGQLVAEWPNKHPSISLRQLTNHTSGIRHYRGKEFLSNKQYSTRTDALAIFKQDSLKFQPGKSFSYSTYAWTLVSAAMEKGDKVRNFKQIIRDEVIFPLELNDTTFDDHAPIIKNRHTPYSYRNKQLYNSPAVNSSYKYAGGGFLSSASDVAKFAMAHAQEGYLKQASLTQMMTKTAGNKGSNFGIGWLVGFDSYLKNYKKEPVLNQQAINVMNRHANSVMHAGGSMGGTTMMILCLEHNHSIVVVKNVSGEKSANVFQLALLTLDLFTDVEK